MHIIEPWTMHGGGMYTLSSDGLHSSLIPSMRKKSIFPPIFVLVI